MSIRIKAGLSLLVTVHGQDHFVALLLQAPRQHVAVHLIVFD